MIRKRKQQQSASWLSRIPATSSALLRAARLLCCLLSITLIQVSQVQVYCQLMKHNQYSASTGNGYFRPMIRALGGARGELQPSGGRARALNLQRVHQVNGGAPKEPAARLLQHGDSARAPPSSLQLAQIAAAALAARHRLNQPQLLAAQLDEQLGGAKLGVQMTRNLRSSTGGPTRGHSDRLMVADRRASSAGSSSSAKQAGDIFSSAPNELLGGAHTQSSGSRDKGEPAGNQKSAEQKVLICYYTSKKSAPYWPKDAREFILPADELSLHTRIAQHQHQHQEQQAQHQQLSLMRNSAAIGQPAVLAAKQVKNLPPNYSLLESGEQRQHQVQLQAQQSKENNNENINFINHHNGQRQTAQVLIRPLSEERQKLSAEQLFAGGQMVLISPPPAASVNNAAFSIEARMQPPTQSQSQLQSQAQLQQQQLQQPMQPTSVNHQAALRHLDARQDNQPLDRQLLGPTQVAPGSGTNNSGATLAQLANEQLHLQHQQQQHQFQQQKQMQQLQSIQRNVELVDNGLIVAAAGSTGTVSLSAAAPLREGQKLQPFQHSGASSDAPTVVGQPDQQQTFLKPNNGANTNNGNGNNNNNNSNLDHPDDGATGQEALQASSAGSSGSAGSASGASTAATSLGRNLRQPSQLAFSSPAARPAHFGPTAALQSGGLVHAKENELASGNRDKLWPGQQTQPTLGQRPSQPPSGQTEESSPHRSPPSPQHHRAKSLPLQAADSAEGSSSGPSSGSSSSSSASSAPSGQQRVFFDVGQPAGSPYTSSSALVQRYVPVPGGQSNELAAHDRLSSASPKMADFQLEGHNALPPTSAASFAMLDQLAHSTSVAPTSSATNVATLPFGAASSSSAATSSSAASYLLVEPARDTDNTRQQAAYKTASTAAGNSLSAALVSSPLSTMFDVFGAASQYLMRFKPSSLISPSAFGNSFNNLVSDHHKNNNNHLFTNQQQQQQHSAGSSATSEPAGSSNFSRVRFSSEPGTGPNKTGSSSSSSSASFASSFMSLPFSSGSTGILSGAMQKPASNERSGNGASSLTSKSASSSSAGGFFARLASQSNQQREDICGRTIQTPERRIIGGEGARYGEFPYQVHIKIAKHQCGGALVDKQSIVTAAHCVYHFITRAPVSKLQIVIGAYDIEDEQYQELPPQYFKVNKVKLHPNFRFSASHPDRYDVAILKLDKPVKYTDNVLPVCLPSKDLKFESMVGTVTGFGKTDPSLSNRYGTRLLQKVDVPIIENSECERWHRTRGIDLKIFPEMMCAGYEDGLKDACVGDSGGPLVVKTPVGSNGSFRWTLAGITSAGFGCAQSRQPGIYHRISHTVDWILDNLD